MRVANKASAKQFGGFFCRRQSLRLLQMLFLFLSAIRLVVTSSTPTSPSCLSDPLPMPSPCPRHLQLCRSDEWTQIERAVFFNCYQKVLNIWSSLALIYDVVTDQIQQGYVEKISCIRDAVRKKNRIIFGKSSEAEDPPCFFKKNYGVCFIFGPGIFFLSENDHHLW